MAGRIGVTYVKLSPSESRALQALDAYLMHSVWLSEDARSTLIAERVARLVEGGALEWIEEEFAALGETIASYEAEEGPACAFAVRLDAVRVITVYVSVLVPWAVVSLFRWPLDAPDEKRRFLGVQTSSSHVAEAAEIVSRLMSWGFYLASEAQCRHTTGLPGGHGALLAYHELLFQYPGYFEPPWAWR